MEECLNCRFISVITSSQINGQINVCNCCGSEEYSNQVGRDMKCKCYEENKND